MGVELKRRSLLKLNLRLFLDLILLREGGFQVISSGLPFYSGEDMSLLLPDTTATSEFVGLSAGQIWQSAFRNWIYESGIPIDGTGLTAAPTTPSGVYIYGAFRPTNDPVFGHTIDYLQGRVIFNSPQSLDAKVQADFSAKDIRLSFEHLFNQQFQKGYLEAKFTTNPGTSSQLIYPSGSEAQPWPAVFIDVDARTFTAYEMGNRSLIAKDTVNLFVWALDDLQRDNIVDILSAQERKVFPIIDWNITPLPLSGIFNTLSPSYIPYQLLLGNPIVNGQRPVKYMAYICNTRLQNIPSAKEYERAIVTFDVETYLVAPSATLPNFMGPINQIGEIGDIGM